MPPRRLIGARSPLRYIALVTHALESSPSTVTTDCIIMSVLTPPYSAARACFTNDASRHAIRALPEISCDALLRPRHLYRPILALESEPQARAPDYIEAIVEVR